MTIQVGLNIVTLVMCIITMTMASAALMPQIKQGLVILRDGLLWTLLIGVVGFVGFIGWERLYEARQQRTNKIDDAILLDNAPESTRRVSDKRLMTRPTAAHGPAPVVADLVVEHSAQPSQTWNRRSGSSRPNLDVTQYSRN